MEILSLGCDLQAVVPHFQSGLFDSLSGLALDDVDATLILAMISSQGEQVKLLKPLDAKGMPTKSTNRNEHFCTHAVPKWPAYAGNVEQWLTKLVSTMQATVKSVIRTAFSCIEESKVVDFITAHPAQAALLAIQFSMDN